MSIVLNEYEWAEQMILRKELGSRPSETLNRVAKYYYENNYSKREVRKLLDQFLVSCDPDASLFSWSSALDKIAKTAIKYSSVQIDHIPITKVELNTITDLPTQHEQRVAFVLLCVSKYWDVVSDSNNHWVNTTEREIFTMANISISTKRQNLLYGKLLKAGLIRASKKIDNLNVQVTFQDQEKNEPILLITDFRNLGYQYLKYLGGPYFECENCGIVTKLIDHKKYQSVRADSYHGGRGRRQRYCQNCAAEKKIQQNIESVMRRRKKSV